ncbi:MAG TPA: glycosyltransferase, partial [Chloroflexia bacterium]
MTEMLPDVSVVICAYTEDRWFDIERAIESIRRQSMPAREIILVVDHNAQLLARARAALPDVLVVENREARGLSGARNSGIEVAQGALVAFLDDDAEADPDWLAYLTGACADPHVLGAGGRVDPLWQVDPPRWFPDEFFWVLGCTYRGLPQESAPVRNLYGGCGCIRRTAFSAVGGFRSGLGRIGTRPLGGEETEFCIRLQQHDPQGIFIYEPRARIRHRIPAQRARWDYFARRCYSEGLSKAAIARLVGTQDGLAAERAYTLRTLPRGVQHGLADSVLRRDPGGLGRAAAIVGGLACTSAGYILGTARQAPAGRGRRHIPVQTLEAPPVPAGPAAVTAVRGPVANVHPPTRDRPLRVLQVTARYFPYMGGVETHVYEVSRRLAASGVDVTVLTSDPTDRLPAQEEVDGVQIRRVRAWPAERDYYFAPGIYSQIRSGSWDVVHVQCYHTLVTPLALLAARRANIPFLLTFHSGGHSSRARNAVRGIQRKILRPLLAPASRLVGVSQFEADFFHRHLQLPAAKFVIIPNGSQLPRVEEPSEPGEPGPLLVSVGRLEQYKGHQRIIRALPFILAEQPNARLRIAGTGPYESALRRLSEELGIADRVVIGPIPPVDRQGMARLLSQAALVTLLSDYEAHPVAVMEALALGRPVLVTDTSGLHEIATRWGVPSVPLASPAPAVAAAVLEQLRRPWCPPTVELPTWDGCANALLTL